MDQKAGVTESLNIARLVAIFRRWRWLMVAVVAISVGVAYAILERMTPTFRATSTVVVSPKAPQIIADIKEIIDLPDGGRRDFDDYIQTQLDIVRSQQVAELVLDELDLWDDERLFRRPTEPTDPEEAGVLRLKRATELAKQIRARRVPDSLIIQVQFEHEDPELASQIANSVARNYVNQNLSLRRTMLDRASNKLKTLLEERRVTKDAAENRVRELEDELNIAVVATRRKEVGEDRSYYNQLLREANRQVTEAEALVQRLDTIKRTGIYGVPLPQALDNSVLSTLKVQYMTIKNEVSELELVYGERHFKLRGAKQRLRQVRHAIRLEITQFFEIAQGNLEQARTHQHRFQSMFDEARSEDEKLAVAVEEHVRRSKALDEETALYDRLRKRLEETTITTSLASASNNVRILDQALIPRKAVWPRRVPIIGGSIIFGLILGAALILLLERVDTTIRDKEHAERVLVGVPCLGLVPTISATTGVPDLEGLRMRDLYVFENSLSEPAEQARTLRTNILFLSAERKLKTLLVTSALPEEGKTTIAVQTGITLAAAGGRTVLIEADMRRPRLGATLNVRQDCGLSTYLANRDTDVGEVVQKTLVPNLDVIVCGLIPPNPAELLNSLRLNQLLAKLHEQYDMVIIDSPPVNAVSDALVMASRVDGVLIVAKAKRTTSEALRTAYRSLLNVDAPVIGTVLNDLHRGSFGYYKRGKYYRKGYYRRSPDELLGHADKEAGGVG